DFVEKTSIDPGVETAIGAVVMRVFSHPPMVVNCGMKRLRGIAHVMAHYAHNVSDVLPRIGYFLSSASAFLECFKIRKPGFELAVIFRDRPRQESHELASM